MRWAFLLGAALTCCLRADVPNQTSPAVQRTPLTLSGKPQQTDLETRVIELNAMAVEKGKSGDYRSAAGLLEQARQACAPPAVVSPGFYSNVLANLADTYEQLSDWGRAIPLLREAASADEKSFGSSDPRTARMQVRLASAEVVVGNFAEAEPLLMHAIQVQRSAPKANRFELALSLTGVALLDLNTNRPADAEQFASEAVAIAQSERTENADFAAMLSVLGSAYVVRGQGARALPLLNRSIALLERTLSPEHARIAPVLVQRGVLEAAEHKYTLAEQDMRRAAAILDRTGGPGSPNGDWARFRLVQVYLDEHKLAEADEILPAAVDRQRKFFAGNNVRLAYFIREFGRLRAMQKRYSEAMSLYREAIAMAAALPSMHSRTAGSRESAALFNTTGPAREKDVRRIEQRADEVFGFRTAE